MVMLTGRAYPGFILKMQVLACKVSKHLWRSTQMIVSLQSWAWLSATPYVTYTGIVFLVASGGCMADA